MVRENKILEGGTYRYHRGTASFFHASSLAAARLAAILEPFADGLVVAGLVRSAGGR